MNMIRFSNITTCQGRFVTGIGSADHEHGNSRI